MIKCEMYDTDFETVIKLLEEHRSRRFLKSTPVDYMRFCDLIERVKNSVIEQY